MELLSLGTKVLRDESYVIQRATEDRVKFNGRYGILNVDLTGTGSFCCDFEFSCLVLQSGVVLKLL